jgi:hypothetical protein
MESVTKLVKTNAAAAAAAAAIIITANMLCFIVGGKQDRVIFTDVLNVRLIESTLMRVQGDIMQFYNESETKSILKYFKTAIAKNHIQGGLS